MMFQAHKQLLHFTQQRFLADPQSSAGDEGERLTAECIRQSLKVRKGEARLYPSLRVPRKDGSGKAEIDFVLLSPQGLWVIEVKHWSGRIRRSGSQFFQESSPSKKSLEDPWLVTHKKSLDLIHWLQMQGCDISPAAVKTLVVFSHTSMEWQGDIQESGILRLRELPHYLGSHLLHSAPRPLPFDFSALKAQLKRLPTWDLLYFHGGRLWRGDLHSLNIQTPKQNFSFSRQSFAEAEIVCPRSLWQSLLSSPRLALTDWQGKQTRFRFGAGSHVLFQAAGQVQREQLSLLHLEYLSLGSRDQNYYQTRNLAKIYK